MWTNSFSITSISEPQPSQYLCPSERGTTTSLDGTPLKVSSPVRFALRVCSLIMIVSVSCIPSAGHVSCSASLNRFNCPSIFLDFSLDMPKSFFVRYSTCSRSPAIVELHSSIILRTDRIKGLVFLACVTSTGRAGGARRLFFSTVFPGQLQVFCAWQEKSPLNQTGSSRMQYIPLFLYSFRWNIEVSYYEQKSFWSLCSYMVRSRKGIEMPVNLINISYCSMKLLPYLEEPFTQYRNVSVQEFRFVLSGQIRQQVFYVNLVQNIETHIKSSAIIKALKHLCLKQMG